MGKKQPAGLGTGIGKWPEHQSWKTSGGIVPVTVGCGGDRLSSHFCFWFPCFSCKASCLPTLHSAALLAIPPSCAWTEGCAHCRALQALFSSRFFHPFTFQRVFFQQQKNNKKKKRNRCRSLPQLPAENKAGFKASAQGPFRKRAETPCKWPKAVPDIPRDIPSASAGVAWWHGRCWPCPQGVNCLGRVGDLDVPPPGPLGASL